MIYFALAIFTLSAGLTSGGILLGTRLRSRYKIKGFTTLLYYLVFIFTFGFYALWGQTVIRVMVSEIVSEDLITRITHIFVLMGLPFLVLAWLMLIKFAREITLRPKEKYLTGTFLIFNTVLIVFTGWSLYQWPEFDALLLLKYFYLAPGSLYTALILIIFLFQKEKRFIISKHDRTVIALSSLLFFIAEAFLLIYYTGEQLIGLIFIFVFFTGKAFLPGWLKYKADLTRINPQLPVKLSFSVFFERFDISVRESEIIHEICKGKSNAEIAESLFISLQTVKDHTHRIYIKTNVRNRMQLMTLAREHGL